MEDLLTGKTSIHLVPVPGTSYLVHKDMLHDYLKLKADAQEAGFQLEIISGFRDFDRQLRIWNAKASGQRQLLDDQERPLDFNQLSQTEIVFAILRWSAIPGCSRHHWGTDFDIFDLNTQAKEQVQLIPSETTGNGPATPLHDWLDDQIKTNRAYGFFRPYETDRGGVSPERWHLSYAPLSQKFYEAFSFSLFKKNIEANDILLKDVLLNHAEEIFERYVRNVDRN